MSLYFIVTSPSHCISERLEEEAIVGASSQLGTTVETSVAALSIYNVTYELSGWTLSL